MYILYIYIYYVYMYIHTMYICICMCVDIYIYREREREKKKKINQGTCLDPPMYGVWGISKGIWGVLVEMCIHIKGICCQGAKA